MNLWGIEWPPGWVEVGFVTEGKFAHREGVMLVNSDGDVLFEILRYYAALARQCGHPHVKEYAAIAWWQPGNRVSGYLGYYDTPHEALAECLFYTGR